MHPHQLTDPAAVREFMFAGNARVTLVSKKTGARFTYRVRASDGSGAATHFVSVLTGPSNEADYAYLGCYYKDGRYFHGQRSKISRDAPSARAFEWFAGKPMDHVLDRLEVWHEGRCGRCNRTLTVPESIARGIGPECAGLLAAA